MASIVRLGNRAPIYGEKIDEKTQEPVPNVLEGHYVSEFTVHDDVDPHHDMVRNITHVDGLWARMSAEPATWVSCPGLPRLEMALAAHFDCPILPHEDVVPLVEAALLGQSAVPAHLADEQPVTEQATRREILEDGTPQ
jgi:hypothetical protein